MNVNPRARSGSDALPGRPEPREPGADSRPEPRASGQRAAEARSPELRPAEGRAPEARAPESTPRPSILGPTLRFRGELSAQEDLIVQGAVEGSITHSQNLGIGPEGSMKGDIRARVIVVDGKVDGDLYASEFVHIRATAKVTGNVFSPRIAIQDGAIFQGRVDMQTSGAAVHEHNARLREVAMNAQPLADEAVNQMLNGTDS